MRELFRPSLGKLSLYNDDYRVSHALLDPPTTLVALLAIPALAFAAWSLRTRCPLAALGLLWFFGSQLLTNTIVPLELVYEHRNHFGSLGICLASRRLAAARARNPPRAPGR